MDGAGTIIAIVFVALVLTGGAIAAAYSSQSTAQEFDATDTITTGSIGDAVDLDNASTDYYFSDEIEVRNATGGDLLAADEDYSWNKNNGSVTPLSSEAANTDLDVSYSFGVPSDTQQSTTETIALMLEAGAYIPFLLVLALLFLAVTIFGGLS